MKKDKKLQSLLINYGMQEPPADISEKLMPKLQPSIYIQQRQTINKPVAAACACNGVCYCRDNLVSNNYFNSAFYIQPIFLHTNS